MTVAIGVDVGTTGAQAVAVDEEGRVVASGAMSELTDDLVKAHLSV